MANVKVSELPAASAASTSQEFEVNDSGTSKKVTGSQIKSFVKDGLILTDITDVTASITELNYVDGVTSSVQDQLNDKFKQRTITGTTDQITVTNGDGVAGNPTIAAVIASQAEAEAGTDATKLMTSERTRQASKIKFGTAVATTSGAGVTFTGIPANVNRITVIFDRVSQTVSGDFRVQIGAGSLKTTDYESCSNTTVSAVSSTTGFIVAGSGGGGLNTGLITLTRLSNNTWVSNHVTASNPAARFGAGRVALSGELDQLRFMPNGAGTFTSGSVNISWEF